MSQPSPRYHDYDALRAFAMLLGIVLHGLMSFVELPPGMWPAQDVQQNTPVYGFALHAMHGFRLPLFFLMSGFFTTMLWKKRGLRELLVHRAKRILLPLAVGWCAVWPALILVDLFGAEGQTSVWEAAAEGRIDEVRQYLESGGDSEARFEIPGVPGSGATPLHLAAANGHDDVARLLLDNGAHVDSIAKDRHRSTPLHWAVFTRHLGCVTILVEAGADVQAEDANGYSPHDLASGIQPIDEVTTTIAAYLESKGAVQRDVEVKETPVPATETLGIVVLLACFAPLFAHLWFLWYLCWFVIGFAIVVWLGRWVRWSGLPSRAASWPYCWLWLLPLTLLAQLGMVQSFGPDTSAGLIPWPPTFAYYAVFFAFGAVLFGNEQADLSARRHWRVFLLVALATLPVGVWLFESRPAAEMLTLFDFTSPYQTFPRADLDLSTHFLTSLCAVVYCWSMILALMGLFRRYFSSENARIRYISDSAYWLYIAHLPLIQFVQILVKDWSLPSILKVAIICGATVTLLLVVYEYGVRYTLIGTMLNGKRYRGNSQGKDAASASVPTTSAHAHP